jgi:hypothetical protein
MNSLGRRHRRNCYQARPHRAHASRGKRAVTAPIGISALLIAASLATLTPSSAQTFCSVFDNAPCRPDIPYLFSQDLRVTIQSGDQAAPAIPLKTIQQLFGALRACWTPPPMDQSSPGTQISIRFSLNRAGEIIGEPRYTHSTRSLSQEVKSAYQRAVAAALQRCVPLPLSAGLGGAIAGRPISARFIDNRDLRRTENAHER